MFVQCLSEAHQCRLLSLVHAAHKMRLLAVGYLDLSIARCTLYRMPTVLTDMLTCKMSHLPMGHI